MAKGVIIAGTHSGCGKTTITLGILAALKKKGLKIQSFKAGPDFIDAGLHRIITRRPSTNLDIWMCGEDYVKACFHKHSMDADISIIESAMGLYDGDFNAANLAELLNLPIVLVVDAYGMAESAGAVVKGFVEFRTQNTDNPPSPPFSKGGMGGFISGVIFNRVASENHYRRLKNCVRDVEVLGYLPRNLDFEIPHRHLGLTVAEESPITEENIEKLAAAVMEHISVERVFELVAGSTALSFPLVGNLSAADEEGLRTSRNDNKIKIAIAHDKAFCFYYEDNLDLLKNAGAELVTFSPISDSKIPDNVNAIYIGGGYPELHAEELSRNTSMLESIHNWADSGNPIYAECGGLMYLSQGINDFTGNFLKMTGIFPFETQIPPYPPLAKGCMGGLRPHLGYREILLKDDCIIGKRGDRVRGHEFHYSEIKESSNTGLSSQYKVKDGSGQNIQDEGYKFKNTLASYIHIHFGSNPDIAGNFIDFIREK
jgi:cobyrinic acid a,c-diamide synthase